MAQPRNRGLKRHSKMLKTLPRPAHLTLGHPCLLGLAASSLEADTRQYFLCINRGWVLVDGCPSWYYTLEQTSGGSPAVQNGVWLKKPETRTFITLRVKGSRHLLQDTAPNPSLIKIPPLLERKDNPLQYSSLGNPKDRGA